MRPFFLMWRHSIAALSSGLCSTDTCIFFGILKNPLKNNVWENTGIRNARGSNTLGCIPTGDGIWGLKSRGHFTPPIVFYGVAWYPKKIIFRGVLSMSEIWGNPCAPTNVS